MILEYFATRKEKRRLVRSQRWEKAHGMREKERELANILVRSIAPTTAALNEALNETPTSRDKYNQDAILEYCEGLYGTRDEDAIIKAITREIKLEDLGI